MVVGVVGPVSVGVEREEGEAAGRVGLGRGISWHRKQAGVFSSFIYEHS